MKILVVKKDKLIIYSLIALLTIGLISYNLLMGNDSVAVANQKGDLPIYCVENNQKQIAITFDCAWEDKDTDQIITILQKYNAKATFFGVGEWVDRCAGSVKKFFDAGHEIMNHSDNHKYPTKMPKDELISDLNSCSKKIEAITGVYPKLYRTPYGDYNSAVVSTAKEAGYQTIQWSVDSIDWKDISIDEIYKRVIDRTKDGDILLFHTGKANTLAALDKILNKLSSDGYQFILTSELVFEKDYVIDNNGMQKLATPKDMQTFN